MVIFAIFTLSLASNTTNQHLLKDIGQLDFQGYWDSLQNQNPSPQFQQNSGLAQVLFKKNKHQLETTFLLYDGKWTSGSSIKLHCEKGNYIYTQIKVNTNCTIKELDKNDQRFCQTQGQLQFKNLNLKHFTGEFKSQNCKFNFLIQGSALSQDQKIHLSKTYTIVFSFISLLLAFGYIGHTHTCLLSETSAAKSNQLTWFMNGCIDCFLWLWHLNLGIIHADTFDYLVLASIWSFALFIIIQSRLLLVIFKAQHPQLEVLNSATLRRVLMQYQNKVFINMIMVVLVIISLSAVYHLTVVLMYSFFIPQIVKNAQEGLRFSIQNKYVFALAIARSIHIFYILGYSDNFQRWEPQPEFAFGVSFYVFLQALVLVLQSSRLGPRFLVPKRFRPVRYEYFRTLEEEELEVQENLECVICMTVLFVQGRSAEDVVNKARILHTPCGHKFHQDCLSQWMEIKLECPTCREKIPMLESL